MNKPTARTGDWICTFTGKKFYLLDPRPEDICIKDIAHALSMICRFGGHCAEFYSVAQHSVLVTNILEKRFPNDFDLHLYALLHDAAEAYIGDMVRPLKVSMPNFKAAERNIEDAIYQAFGLAPLSETYAQFIKQVDDAALMTERRDLINHRDYRWNVHEAPLDVSIFPAPPDSARLMFRRKFLELAQKLNLRGDLSEE